MLIANPVSKYMCKLSDEMLAELDNGDDIGEYKIYTGTSFINALSRDCLGKGKSIKHYRY